MWKTVERSSLCRQEGGKKRSKTVMCGKPLNAARCDPDKIYLRLALQKALLLLVELFLRENSLVKKLLVVCKFG